MNTLKEKYHKVIKQALASELNITNIMALPKVEKVVINTGIGEIAKSKEQMEAVSKDLALITGQKPSLRKAKVSVASFSVRKGMPVGMKVTLRGERMYDFLQKLFSVVLPRLRDFRGLSNQSFDRVGNYTLAILEHTIFPEIDITKSGKVIGLEITIVTNTGSAEKSKKLLELMGMPFAKEGKNE